MTVNTGNNNNNNNNNNNIGNNNNGNITNVMDGICQVIAKLLHPSVKETAGMKVGSLITQIIVSLGNKIIKIPQNTFTQMLITIIQRLLLADFSELKQSLVLIFARLVNIYDKTIINFLANYQCNNNNNNDEKEMLLANVRIGNYQVNLNNNE